MIDEGKKQAAELAKQFWKLWGSADLHCTAEQPPRLEPNGCVKASSEYSASPRGHCVAQRRSQGRQSDYAAPARLISTTTASHGGGHHASSRLLAIFLAIRCWWWGPASRWSMPTLLPPFWWGQSQRRVRLVVGWSGIGSDDRLLRFPRGAWGVAAR